MEVLRRTATRRHRDRYLGVLAPNSPLREAVTALAAVPALHTESPTQNETTTDEPPTLKPARGAPLWELPNSEFGEIDPQA